MVSECGIDIREAGAVLPATSELVWLNGRVHDSVTDHFGVVSEDSGNWTWVLVAARNVRSVCCTLHCTGRCCMKLVVFLAILCLASTSLGSTSVPLKWGRCVMKSVRQKRPANTDNILSCVFVCLANHLCLGPCLILFALRRSLHVPPYHVHCNKMTQIDGLFKKWRYVPQSTVHFRLDGKVICRLGCGIHNVK